MQKLALADKVQNERLVMCPYYNQDGMIIYNEDCRKAMLALRQEVDYTITSPPYNIGANNMRPPKYGKKVIDIKTDNEYYDLLDEALGIMIDITKYHVFFNVQMLSANRTVIIELMYKYRDKYKDRIIWNKTNAAPAIEPGVMNSSFEDIHIFTKLDPEKRKFDNCSFERGTLKNVLSGTIAVNREYSKKHRATFPEYLPGWIIKNFTQKGDTILDPFAGTGTTLFVARKLGRKAVGIELRQDYCDLALHRLSQTEMFS